MEYIICCLCSLLCFVCGVWAARGIKWPRRKRKKPEGEIMQTPAEDALSRDIAVEMTDCIACSALFKAAPANHRILSSSPRRLNRF